jgi:hypothetical protein
MATAWALIPIVSDLPGPAHSTLGAQSSTPDFSTISLAGGGRGELISENSHPLTARILRASEGARLC